MSENQLGIFPILIECDHNGHGALSFQTYFLASKPKDLIWYGYDTVIQSSTRVEFVVYDMADSATGGLGKEIASFETVVPDGATNRAIEGKIMSLARYRREKELLLAEEAIVSSYANEIRNSMTPAPPSPIGGEQP